MNKNKKNILFFGKIKLSISLLAIYFSILPLSAHNVESYLLKKDNREIVVIGVNHGARADLWPPSKALAPFFKRASKVLVEFNFTDDILVNDNARQLVTAGDMSVKNFVSEAELEELHRFAKSEISFYRLTEKALGDVHACLVSPWLSPSRSVIEPKEAEKSRVPSYEQYFLIGAKKLGKEIVALEPQGSTLSCEELSTVEIHKLLTAPLKLAKQHEAITKYFETLDKSDVEYRAGMGSAAYESYLSVFEYDPEYKNAQSHWLTIRNRAMFESLQKQLVLDDTDSFFMLVGAWHLYGSLGMLNLLKEHGFEISKIE